MYASLHLFQEIEPTSSKHQTPLIDKSFFRRKRTMHLVKLLTILLFSKLTPLNLLDPQSEVQRKNPLFLLIATLKFHQSEESLSLDLQVLIGQWTSHPSILSPLLRNPQLQSLYKVAIRNLHPRNSKSGIINLLSQRLVVLLPDRSIQQPSISSIRLTTVWWMSSAKSRDLQLL